MPRADRQPGRPGGSLPLALRPDGNRVTGRRRTFRHRCRLRTGGHPAREDGPARLPRPLRYAAGSQGAAAGGRRVRLPRTLRPVRTSRGGGRSALRPTGSRHGIACGTHVATCSASPALAAGRCFGTASCRRGPAWGTPAHHGEFTSRFGGRRCCRTSGHRRNCRGRQYGAAPAQGVLPAKPGRPASHRPEPGRVRGRVRTRRPVPVGHRRCAFVVREEQQGGIAGSAGRQGCRRRIRRGVVEKNSPRANGRPNHARRTRAVRKKRNRNSPRRPRV